MILFVTTMWQLWLLYKTLVFFVSQFWRPELQTQGVGRVGSFWELWGKDLFQASLLGL